MINVEEFITDIQQSTLLNKEHDNVEVLVNCYNDELKRILDTHAPEKEKLVTIHPTSPWNNADIINARHIKRKAERDYRRTKLQVHKMIYHEARNTLIRLISKSKEEYISKQISESTESQRTLFKCLGSLLNKKSDPRLPDNDDLSELSNSFVNFFSDKVTKIRNGLMNLEIDQQEVSNLTIDTTPSLIMSSFAPATQDEVKKVIMSSASKSFMLDPLPVILVEGLLACTVASHHTDHQSLSIKCKSPSPLQTRCCYRTVKEKEP